jgi:hypothetical protein
MSSCFDDGSVGTKEGHHHLCAFGFSACGAEKVWRALRGAELKFEVDFNAILQCWVYISSDSTYSLTRRCFGR